MENTYRLEFNEKQQMYHLDNYSHEENTFGWTTIINHCTDTEFMVFEAYVNIERPKNLTREYLVDCAKEVKKFTENLMEYELNISKENNINYTPGTFSKESVDKALKNTKDPMFFMDEATRNEINDRMMEDLSPIGLKPLWLNKEARYIEIKEAINRYNQAKKSVPQEWIDELNETEEWIKNWRKSKK